MIKLKEILQESKNIELHKVITSKDTPSFMTEEQWEKKWVGNRCAITEAIISETDEKEAKKVIKKELPLLKRLLLKYLSKHAKGVDKLKGTKVQKILTRYLKTGKLSKNDAVDIYTDVRAFIVGYGSAGPIAAAMIATFSFLPMIIFPIAFAVLAYLTSKGKFLSKFFPKDISDEDIKEFERLVYKRYVYAKNKSKTFKSII